jgi:hypothetical protein
MQTETAHYVKFIFSIKVWDDEPIINKLAALPIGDPWNDAEMWTVYSYVRGSKLLSMPDNLKGILCNHTC